MNIIKLIGLYIKFNYRRLSPEEFTEVLKISKSANGKGFLARQILRRYFTIHKMEKRELDDIAASGVDGWVYDIILEGFGRKSAPLPEIFFEYLLETQRVNLLENHMSHIKLTTSSEALLLQSAMKEKRFNLGARGTCFGVLTSYLCSSHDYVFSDKLLQVKLAFNKDVLHMFMNKSDISHCIVGSALIRYMLRLDKKAHLCHLLANSYIADEKMREEILEKYPDLEAALEISAIRRQVFEAEERYGQKLGGKYMFAQEMAFCLSTDMCNWTENEKQNYITNYVMPMLSQQYISPAFVAWVAYIFPSVSQIAFVRLQKKSEKFQEAEKWGDRKVVIELPENIY